MLNIIFVISGQCYRDNSNRVLKGDDTCIREGRCFFRSQDMTIGRCKEYCHARGWALAGVEWYTECFCGNEAPTNMISDSECDRPCGGDNAQMCGGAWALNVHDVYHITDGMIFYFELITFNF